MEIKLPGEKITKIRTETRKLKDQDNPQAIALSRLLGKLNHATHAIPPAPLLLYHNLQSCLQGALEAGDQDYATPVRLTPECIEELVEETPDQLEWAMSDLSKTIASDGDRCINHRLRSYT